MGENSKIEWTTHTFNPWRGCTKVSAGCANCYAETLSHRNPAVLGEWGKGKPRVLASEKMWREPLRWNAAARYAPLRPRVFCASLADWLDDEVPIEWSTRLLQLFRDTPHLIWLLPTKRPQNWLPRVKAVFDALHPTLSRPLLLDWLEKWLSGDAPNNVWIGVSVENQQAADERIPLLLAIPARVRFLSCEPLLGPVNLAVHGHRIGSPKSAVRGVVDWVICGGESGPNARPMHPDWARSLRDQCAAAGVPFFFKQWGEWLPYNMGRAFYAGFKESRVIKNGSGQTGWPVYRVGKKAAGRLLDGVEHNEFPA